MYDNCLYPDSWSRGIIVPVPKKGDMRNVNNYRGITLTSIFNKCVDIFVCMLVNIICFSHICMLC